MDVIRAIFFDFYSVWLPDVFQPYLDQAKPRGTEFEESIKSEIEKYYHGKANLDEVASALRYKLGRPDIDVSGFRLPGEQISPTIVDFMRGLHGHFLKIGILANLGPQELKLLTEFNQRYQVFEVIASPISLQLPQRLLTNGVFATALQLIGEPPASCVAVSGHPEYQVFAERLGMKVIPFAGFPALTESLDELLAKDSA